MESIELSLYLKMIICRFEFWDARIISIKTSACLKKFFVSRTSRTTLFQGILFQILDLISNLKKNKKNTK